MSLSKSHLRKVRLRHKKSCHHPSAYVLGLVMRLCLLSRFLRPLVIPIIEVRTPVLGPVHLEIAPHTDQYIARALDFEY